MREAEAGQLRLKPFLAEGEESCLVLNDPDAVVAILQTNI